MPRSTSVKGSPDKPHTDLATPSEGPVSADYSLVRSARRFVPKGIVTVSVGEGGFPLACGEVRDISETGACMLTDFVLGRGRALNLQLNFSDWLRIETDAQIVWSGEGKDWKGGVVGAVDHSLAYLMTRSDAEPRIAYTHPKINSWAMAFEEVV